MYIHLGRDYVLNDRDIIGIFNLETTTISPRGREFLNYAQKNGAVAQGRASAGKAGPCPWLRRAQRPCHSSGGHR